jgi:hypothetical protein
VGRRKSKMGMIVTAVAAAATVTVTATTIRSAMTVKANNLLSDINYLPTITITTQGVAASVALNDLVMPI